MVCTLRKTDSVKVKEALRTLGLLGTTTTPLGTTLGLLGLLHLGTIGHEIDSVLACETLYSRNGSIIHRCLTLGISRHVNDSNLLTLPRIIQHDANLEGALATGSQIDAKRGVVALLGTLESLTALGILIQLLLLGPYIKAA